MATTPVEIDNELESLVPAETESQALVLQGVVSLQKITDSATYLRIVSAGTDAASNIKSIKAIFEPICQERYARHKRATSLMAEKLQPFEEIKRKASQLVGAYDQEQERLRRAEEARLQREENERARLAQAEQRKLAEAEARRIADERAIADALELEAAGDKKGADAVLNNPVPVEVYVPPVMPSPVILQKTVPKAEGKSSMTTYTFRVEHSPKCRAIGDHEPEDCSVCLADVPREYLILNCKFVGQQVRSLREKFVVPGITVVPLGGARFKG